MIAAFRRRPFHGAALAAPPAALLSGHNPNSRVSDDSAALSGYNFKAPGYAGGYLHSFKQDMILRCRL